MLRTFILLSERKICGKNYRRKINNVGSKYAKPVWICSTFNQMGKSECSSQQIPENILLSISAEVLGLSEFDEVIFEKQIKEIRVPKPNTLFFVFNNGNPIEKQWQNKSRKSSWSDEAKQQAREREIGRMKSK
jgi:site-specific DNA recombinase